MNNETEVVKTSPVLTGWIVYDTATGSFCYDTFNKSKATAKKLWKDVYGKKAPANYEKANLQLCGVFVDMPGEKF